MMMFRKARGTSPAKPIAKTSAAQGVVDSGRQ
jgi:hypothetical protein